MRLNRLLASAAVLAMTAPLALGGSVQAQSTPAVM